MFKDIDIGFLIKERVTECGIEIPRICSFLQCTENHVLEMYRSKSMDARLLLRWSKLLEYDFFRIYSQHLILHSPQSSREYNNLKESNKKLPRFRKNLYTKEIIDFILELLETKQKTRLQVIKEYNIPKTTLYKWIDKYKK